MQEPNDKQLHDWVRQTLQTYQPAPQPQDWMRMQKKLRQRYWWRMGSIGLGGMLIGIVGIWWFYTHSATEKPAPAKVNIVSIQPEVEQIAGKQNQVISLINADSSATAMERKIINRQMNRKRFNSIELIQTEPVLQPDMPLLLRQKAEKDLPKISVPLYSLEENEIRHQMQTGEFGADSTSYQVFGRNIRKWPDVVVVCDLTTSMYPYSTQIFAWLRKNSKQPNVKAVVFFTDCDNTGRETQPLSKSGQMFVSTSMQSEKVLPIMLQAARNTVRNGNSEENDIEALLYAQQRFPEAKHFVLLADNSSAVKDMALLKQINKPVHVILCGNAADSTQAFQPEYWEIALQTKGSLHTIEDDLRPGQETKQPWMRVGERYYKYNARKNQYKASNFRHRPMRILGLFWL